MRIRILDMEDQHGLDRGMEGTVVKVDDLGTIHVDWDNGRRLGVIPGIDSYQLLPSVGDQINFDLFNEDENVKITKKISKGSLSKPIDNLFKKNKSKYKLEGEEEVIGGKADNMTISDLAKKHKVDIKDIEKEIEVGTKIEMEHTDSKVKAKEIAMDHIAEFPDYYTNEKYGTIASERGLTSIHENRITLKDEVQRILNILKTAKPTHRESLENMVNNLVNKYKNIKKDEKKFYDLIERLKTKISDKFGVDETTTSGSAGAYNAPLFGKQTVLKKPKTKNTTTKKQTKSTISNPSGKIYPIRKESKTIKVSDLLSEIASTHATKLRSAEGPFDGDSWAGNKKDGWKRRKELAWKGGEITDILSKLDINWTDSDLTLSDKHSKKINETKKENTYFKFSKGDEEGVIVVDLGSKNHIEMVDYLSDNGFKMEKISKKEYDLYDKGDEITIRETTTFTSVFGGSFPVTPFMFAKKGKHKPSKKPIWKGGKIVKKADKADLLGESLLDEINKIKWVKGGKFVKIKDRCAKYNNKPWCSQGAIDNPLELSDTTFENIENISKQTGLSEEYIYNKVINYLGSK